MEPRIFTPTPIDVNDRGHRLRSGSPVTNLPEAAARPATNNQLLTEKPFYLLRSQSFSFEIVSEFINTFVKFSNYVQTVGLLTLCFVPRRGFLYIMIVPGGGFCSLQVMSRWFV